MPDFRVSIFISSSEIQPVKDSLKRLAYVDIQHWLLDMIRLQMLDELEFAAWTPRKNRQTDLTTVSVRLPEEYKIRAERAIHDAGFTTNTQWLLACIDWTMERERKE